MNLNEDALRENNMFTVFELNVSLFTIYKLFDLSAFYNYIYLY